MSNNDLNYQLEFVVILCNHSDRCHVTEYSSRKSKGVVRSIMGGAVYSFMDAFESAYVIRKELETMVND